MDKALARRLSSDLRIAPEQILREYWEMTLLEAISDQEWSSALGFKGGSALRLAYGSPRFSDDLDFELVRSVTPARLFSWAQTVSERFGLQLTDSEEKRNTLLVEFRIRTDAIPQPIKQKIEISKRQRRTKRNLFPLKLLSSPVTNSQVLLPVASLELMWEEKVSAMADRREPRDLFDLWYIGQKIDRALPSDLPKIPAKHLRTTLGKYLPSKYKNVISTLERL